MSADYLIVGAGSAGCVLADRLSASGKRRVLLLEAGPVDRHPLIAMPKGMARLYSDPRHIWLFETTPERDLSLLPTDERCCAPRLTEGEN